RVVCPLRTGSQHGRDQHNCPQCSENDQDHECQDLSTTFVVDNGNNGCPTSGGSPATQSLQSLRDEHPPTNSQVNTSQEVLARINASARSARTIEKCASRKADAISASRIVNAGILGHQNSGTRDSG